jgi:translation initiation factor IF-1
VPAYSSSSARARRVRRRRTSPPSPRADDGARGRSDDHGLPVPEQLKKGDVIAKKEEKVEVEGEIIESLRNRMFKVRLDNGHEMIGYTAGKLKRYRIRMFLGDRVRIELSPYDLNRGRIVYRLR